MAKEADLLNPRKGARFGLPDDFEASSSAASGPAPGSPKRKSPESDATSGTQGPSFTTATTEAVKAAKPVHIEAAPSLFRFSQTAPSQPSPRRASWQARAATAPAPESAANGPSNRFTFASTQTGPKAALAQAAGGQPGLSSRATAGPGTQRDAEAAGNGKQPAARSARSETGAGPGRPGVSNPADHGTSSGHRGLNAADRPSHVWAGAAPNSSMPQGTNLRPAGAGPLLNGLHGNGKAPSSAAVQIPSAGPSAIGSETESPGFVFGQGFKAPAALHGTRSAPRRRGKPPISVRTPAQHIQEEANMDFSPMDYSPYGQAEGAFSQPDTERDHPAAAFSFEAKLNLAPNGCLTPRPGPIAGGTESSDAYDSAASQPDSEEEDTTERTRVHSGFGSSGAPAASPVEASWLPGAFHHKVTLRPSPRRRKPASPAHRTGTAINKDSDEEHDSDGIVNDFAGVHPFAKPSTTCQPSMESLFAAKVQVRPGGSGSGSRSMSISHDVGPQAEERAYLPAEANNVPPKPGPGVSSAPFGESTSSFSFPSSVPDVAAECTSHSAAAMGGDDVPSATRRNPLASVAPAPSFFAFMTSGQPGIARRSPRSNKRHPRSPSRPTAQQPISKPAGSTMSAFTQQQSASAAQPTEGSTEARRQLFDFGSYAHQKTSGDAHRQAWPESAASVTSSAPTAKPAPFVFATPPAEEPSKSSTMPSAEQASTAASPRRFDFQQPTEPSQKPGPTATFKFGSRTGSTEKLKVLPSPVPGAFGTFSAGTSSTSGSFTSGAKTSGTSAAAPSRTSPRASKAARSPGKPVRKRASPRKHVPPGLSRMNGQPMPPPPSEQNGHKEGPASEDVASRWAAYTKGIRVNRTDSEHQTGKGGAQEGEQPHSAMANHGAATEGAASSSVTAEIPEGLQTPQAAKSAASVPGETPGPAPMSGMSFAGFPGFAASPSAATEPASQPSLFNSSASIADQGASARSKPAPSQTAGGPVKASTTSAQQWGSSKQSSSSSQSIWGGGGGLFSGAAGRVPEPNPWGKSAPAAEVPRASHAAESNPWGKLAQEAPQDAPAAPAESFSWATGASNIWNKPAQEGPNAGSSGRVAEPNPWGTSAPAAAVGPSGHVPEPRPRGMPAPTAPGGPSGRAPESFAWGHPHAAAAPAPYSSAGATGPFVPQLFGSSGGPFQNFRPPNPYRSTAGGGKQPPAPSVPAFASMPQGAPATTPRSARDKLGRRQQAKNAPNGGLSTTLGGANAQQNTDPNFPAKGPNQRSHADEEQRRHATLSSVERLRQRANEKHTTGDYKAAAALYQEAISQLVAARLEAKSAVLYNNLAATNLQMGRPASALKCSLRALELEPTFLKAAVRAATAHWRLGNIEKAAKLLEQALQQPEPPQEAFRRRHELEVFQKSFEQAFSVATTASTADAVHKVLVDTNILLTQAPNSRDLMSLKAHMLLRLDRVKEADSLAERQVKATEAGTAPPLWPWWVRAQAAFLLGDLSKAASVLVDGVQRWQKAQEAGQPMPLDRLTQVTVEEVQATVTHLKELVRLKEAGNSSMKSKEHATAEGHYNAALAACGDASPAFAAVLHANRAAAHQAMGQLADAIADCLRAKALDPKYAKAHSRLAVLLEECRLHDAAVTVLTDLRALVPDEELAAVMQRLCAAQSSAGRKRTPDHYKLLGLARTCPQDEVRKVYKKLALRFHPDKALVQCKFATSLQASGARLATQTEIENAVKEQASWLFQLIGTANGVLSNPTSRRELDYDLAVDARRASSVNPQWERESFSFRRTAPAYRGFNGPTGFAYPHYDSDRSDEDGFRAHQPGSRSNDSYY